MRFPRRPPLPRRYTVDALERSGLRKTLALIGGVILPILTFAVNRSFGRHALYPDWDDGTYGTWVRISLTSARSSR